jgi:hypothetical protein
MEKIKYYVDYDLDTKQVLFIGIEKNSEHSIELELDDVQYNKLADNLDFMFIKNNKLMLDENYKTKYLASVAARNRIEELKLLLAATDWKVVVNAVKRARQDEINELE